MGTVTLEQIHEDLEFVKKKIIKMEEHMIDVDTVLTGDDIESIGEAEVDLKKGKTKRL